jgi:transglutaminase-like putative cysteine protease
MPRFLAIPLLLCLVAPPARAQDAPAKESLKEYVLKSQGRHAYGLYVATKKAGWEIDEIKIGRRDGKEVAVYTTLMHLVLAFDGVKTVSEEKTTTVYELTGEGQVLFAEVRSRENDKEKVRTAVPKGKGMLLTLEEGGRKIERNVPLPKDTLALQRRLEEWLRGPRQKGDTFTSYSSSWDEEEIDTKEVYTFQEKKTILWGGVETEVYAVQSLSQGAKTDSQLLPDGKLLTGKVGGILEARLEKEAIARRLDEETVDLLTATSIAVDQDLGSARRVDKLTLEIRGLDDFQLPQSHRQKVTPGKDLVVVELSRDFRVEKPQPLAKEDRATYTKATAAIQSDHPSIRELAKQIVGDEKDPVQRARLLARWVYKNLRGSYAANADNALAVLANKAGDCTEHALLFVALARAVDLPAREVGGLGFVTGKKPLFGWHAWAEIHDGSQWVSVDPTWNEVYVDATHIKFSEGSSDLAWVNVAGKIKMKVLKFEARK